MKTTINKCDRCKKDVDVLIDVQIVNQNVKEEKEEEEKSRFSLFEPRISYPTITKEICVNCATEFCRWLDHSENLLSIGENDANTKRL